MERIKQALVVIATAATIFVNYLAGIGYIGGITPQIVSEKYPTFFTPAGYAFSIWGLIYLALIAYTIFQALPKNTGKYDEIRVAYVISSVANCGWIFLWHNLQITASLGAMLVLLGSLAFINSRVIRVSNHAERLLIKAPFNIYLGWVSVATIVNFTIALLANGVNSSDYVSVRISCGLIVVATILGIIMRWKLRNFCFPVVIAWALTAVALKNNLQTLLTVFAAFAVIISLVTALTIFAETQKKNRELI
jgi:translocator protein